MSADPINSFIRSVTLARIFHGYQKIPLIVPYRQHYLGKAAQSNLLFIWSTLCIGPSYRSRPSTLLHLFWIKRWGESLKQGHGLAHAGLNTDGPSGRLHIVSSTIFSIFWSPTITSAIYMLAYFSSQKKFTISLTPNFSCPIKVKPRGTDQG